MGILQYLWSRRSAENPSVPLAAADDWWFTGGKRSSSGVAVNRETALTYSPFFRAVSLLSADTAKLPLHVFKFKDHGKVKDKTHPSYVLLRRKPNSEMTAFTFKRALTTHAIVKGNGYAYITRLGDGSPCELIPLNPECTYPVRADGVLWYLTDVRGEQRKIDPSNILHIKGLSFDGLVGYDLVTKAKESLGHGMAAGTYGSTFFRNNGRPSVVLQTPNKLKAEAKTNLRESWERIHSGLENSHRTAILEDGVTANVLGISAEDAQLVETRTFQIREVSNWTGVPPHKLGDTSNTSYASLEQSNQQYLDEGLDHWLCAWEEECWDKLLSETQKRRDTHEVEFNRNQLLRANLDARGKYYQASIMGGWMSRNDVRADEGRNPIGPEGDKYYVPLNMRTVGGEPDDEDGDDVSPAEGQQEGNLLEVPDVRQSTPWSCGAAATTAVCQYFSKGPQTEAEAIPVLGTNEQDGTDSKDIIRVLLDAGLKVTASSDLTLEDLQRFWQAGQPVICPIQDYGEPEDVENSSGHYVVVIGLGFGYVFVQDPSADNALDGSGSDAAPGRAMIKAEDWMTLWHDADSQGKVLTRFGIAVGKELLPAAAEDEEEDDEEVVDDPTKKDPQTVKDPYAPDSDDKPPADKPARSASALAAHHANLAQVIRRCITRLANKAKRAAKKPASFVQGVESIITESRDSVLDSVQPSMQAASISCGVPFHEGRHADALLSRLKTDLLDAAGRSKAHTLAGEVDKLAMEWTRSIPQDLAWEWLGVEKESSHA